MCCSGLAEYISLCLPWPSCSWAKKYHCVRLEADTLNRPTISQRMKSGPTLVTHKESYG